MAIYGAERGLSRFEGFTDAVFAIALTLLIVEIRPPGSVDGPAINESLFVAVAKQWREFLALLICFLSIGVYWLQHHYTGRLYTRSDHLFSLINLGFLLGVTALPYPLRIWCYSVGTEHEAQASILFTGGMLLPGIFWLGKWLYALPMRRIIDARLDDDYLRGMTKRYEITVGAQALAVPLALFSPRSGAALSLGIAAYYLLPPPRPRYKPGAEPAEEEKIAA
jgi:uncharacterized membrane protein